MSGGRVGVVTGGAMGLGAAIVEALLDQGIVGRVVVLDLVDDPVADDRVDVIGCDVTSVESVQSASARIVDAPSVLVNNAGGDPTDAAPAFLHSPFEDPSLFRRVVDLNFTAAHTVTSVLGPRLGAGSSICNMASIAGQTPSHLHSYGAAKAALIHWTRSMARVLGPTRIRINAVAPGIVRTRQWQAMQPDEQEFRSAMFDAVPLRRDQSPAEIADAVVFLSSGRASSITGQVLAVDGGLTAGPPIVGEWALGDGSTWPSQLGPNTSSSSSIGATP